MSENKNNYEQYFGDGWTMPIKAYRAARELCKRLLNPYYPSGGLGGESPLEQPVEPLTVEDIEPMAHDLFDKRYEQPPLWKGLPYYHEQSNKHLRPDGTQAVFTSEEFQRHLDGGA